MIGAFVRPYIPAIGSMTQQIPEFAVGPGLHRADLSRRRSRRHPLALLLHVFLAASQDALEAKGMSKVRGNCTAVTGGGECIAAICILGGPALLEGACPHGAAIAQWGSMCILHGDPAALCSPGLPSADHP